MRLDRCLLVACVTLSHVCDSAASPPPRDNGQIDDDVRANAKSLQRCVQQSLTRDAPTPGYRATFRIVVDNRHRVTDVKITGVTPPALVLCLSKAVRAWKVKAGPGRHRFQVDVTIP